MICKNCQTENPQGFSFCGGCGESVLNVAPAGLLDDEQLFSGERRFLTVMFCDLVGSTELSDHLDPELIHEIIQQYHSVTGAIIRKEGGVIAQYLGDGLLVYFGYPRALGDDAERAVQAALDIVAQFQDIVPVVDLPAHFQLRVRVGIHSGPVVTVELGQGDNKDRLALGGTPNVAARLEGLAVPNGIAVSGATRAITARRYIFRDLGEHPLKGWSTPLRVYEPIDQVSQPQQSSGQRLMYGRHSELQFLMERLRDARISGAQNIQIAGQSGIGKTKLISTLLENAGADVCEILLRCDADNRQIALMPFQSYLRLELGVQSGTDVDVVVEEMATQVGERDAKALAAMLRLPRADEDGWLQGRPEDQKQLIFEALTHWLRWYAGNRTLLFVLEDLQNSDASTQEFVEFAKRDMAAESVLFVVTERTDRASLNHNDWLSSGSMTLGQLDEADGADLVRSLAVPTNDELKLILRLAQGVPLFIEELALASRAGLASDISEGLQYVFAPKLDRLGSSKRTAIVASVIGRVFDASLLGEVIGIHPNELREDLQNLVNEDVVSTRGEPGHFEFTHALLQEALSANVLHRSLRSLHERVASVLETERPEEVDLHPERLARHWNVARKVSRALPYYLRAADLARSVFANSEAIALAQDGVQMAAEQRDLEPQAAVQVLDLRECLGDVLTLVHESAGAQEQFEAVLYETPAQDIVRRARAHRKIAAVNRYAPGQGGLQDMHTALEVLGDVAGSHGEAWWQEWAQIRFQLAITHYSRGNVDKTEMIATELEPYVSEHGTDAQQADFANQMFLVECMRNRFRSTERSMFYATAFVEAAERAKDLPTLAAAVFGKGMMHLQASDFAQAELLFDRCLELCDQCGYRATQVRGLVYYSVLRRRQNDIDGAKRFVELSAELVRSAGMSMYEHANTGMLAWFAYRDGDYQLTVELGRKALAGWSDVGARYAYRWIASLPLLAASAMMNDLDTVLACLDDLTEGTQQYLDESLMTLIEQCREHPTESCIDALVAEARALSYT